ncbi:MAG: hypothetical protein IT374_11015 [Polyangiaceae bacterium]|nr:hypothetical protein [Polyangiaceae bacterium]
MRVASIVLGLSLSVSSAARAAEPEARRAEVEARLDAGAPYARRWYWGWSGGFAAVSALQLGSLLVLDDPGLRADAVVGGALAGVGAISTLALPLSAASGARSIRALPDETSEQRVARARAGEDALRRAAREARFLTSWIAHAGVVGANAAAAAVSRWVYHRPWDMVALARGTGLVVGELKVLSTPTDAIDAEASLLREVTVAPTVGGVVIGGRF